MIRSFFILEKVFSDHTTIHKFQVYLSDTKKKNTHHSEINTSCYARRSGLNSLDLRHNRFLPMFFHRISLCFIRRQRKYFLCCFFCGASVDRDRQTTLYACTARLFHDVTKISESGGLYYIYILYIIIYSIILYILYLYYMFVDVIVLRADNGSRKHRLPVIQSSRTYEFM